MDSPKRNRGFTLVEVLFAAALLAVILAGLSGVTMNALAVRDRGMQQAEIAQEVQFAMQRMIDHASRTPMLAIPLAEDPATGNLESVFSPGVLVVCMDPTLDRDLDGFADADNDQDGLVDEDWPGDSNNDARVGIGGIDDDNSGVTDFSFAGAQDDDETGSFGGANEDPIDGIDNDGDGAIDEDPPADMNGDGQPGIANVDDDGDGLIDEGDSADDDEDGQSDEDWLDQIVYFMNGTSLIERFPNPSPVDGRDYTERVIAENVTDFRVTRFPRGDRRNDMIEITLQITLGEFTSGVTRRVRIGHALN